MGRLIDAEAADLQCELFTYTRYTGIDEAPYEDATKAIDEAPTVEAIPKADYENRLKADMVAMLTELQISIQELSGCSCECSDGIVDSVDDLIQERINALKENDPSHQK